MIIMGTSMSLNTGGQETEYSKFDWTSVPSSSFTDSIWNSTTDSQKVKKQRRNIYVPSTLRKISAVLSVKRRFANREAAQTTAIRNFLSNVKTTDLKKLIESYDILEYLQGFNQQAELARTPVYSYSEDLLNLYRHHHSADVILKYRGALFPVHKPILCVRCPFFRELLSKINKFGTTVEVNFHNTEISIDHFDKILQYIYSGIPLDVNLARRLPREIITPWSLQNLDSDLKYLLETGIYADACLVFKESKRIKNRKSSHCSCNSCSSQAEYSCHQALLASRSPFLRSIILKKQREMQDQPTKSNELDSIQRMRLVFDEYIIPRRFARLLLHSIYIDNLSMEVFDSCICRCNDDRNNDLNKAYTVNKQAAARDTNNNYIPNFTPYPLSDLLELHGIASFLELSHLTQTCENLIVESVSIENLELLVDWIKSSKSSSWVRRQVVRFMCDEFSSLACSPIFYDIEPDLLYEILQSDFLQVSEGEALKALIDWAEHKQQRMIDNREIHVVSQTLHSMTNKNPLVYKDNTEIENNEGVPADLYEDFVLIVDKLLTKIRFHHILEQDSSKLRQVVSSELKSRFYSEDHHLLYNSHRSWFPTDQRNSRQFLVRPRFFNIYVNEARNYMRSREKTDNDKNCNSKISTDSLLSPPHSYEVISERNGQVLGPQQPLCISSLNKTNNEYYIENLCDAFDKLIERESKNIYDVYSIEQINPDCTKSLPQLDEHTANILKVRVSELKKIAFSDNGIIRLMTDRDKCHLLKFIELRSLRELGIPESYANELHKSSCKLLRYTPKIRSESCSGIYAVHNMYHEED